MGSSQSVSLWRFAALGAAMIAMPGLASAAMITLSTDSSDSTPPGVLDATFDFSISGSTLTLVVTNTTSWPADYNINEVYFNAPVGVSLSFDGLTGWSYTTSVPADGFGVFSHALIDGTGADPEVLMPGASKIFTFTILSGAPLDTDFTTYFSTIPPGDTPAIAVAKFVSGPGDDSAFGAYIPAPGAAALILTPLVLGRRRR